MKVGWGVQNPLEASLLLLLGDNYHVWVDHFHCCRRSSVLSEHAKWQLGRGATHSWMRKLFIHVNY